MEWLNEKVESLPNGNKLYKIICFLLGKRKKKMNYKEIYLIVQRLNEKRLGKEKSKRVAMNRIIQIYEFQHGHKPNLLKNNICK